MRFKADGETSFFKLMSKDYHGEVAKFSELVWFRILAKQPKLAEQMREANWVGKLERSDEHLLAISWFDLFSQSDSEKTTGRTVEFGECQSCVGELLGAASAHRARRTDHKTEVHHEPNVGPALSNTALYNDAHWVQDHIRPIVERDSSLFGPRSLLKQKFQSVQKRSCGRGTNRSKRGQL